ncbi:MAG: UTP--glucose-1-phosphate uridylyltransferase [Legionellales bacterium]|nr:UTP--glucose-1-phosphate uridylyltransferase [Legionellales bacterium]
MITKAVFPVAGLGTRFLPATKANPKEMLPIVDKPVIQYAVEEAIEAGIRELIFVTSSAKRAIEDHFDSNFELEYRLRKNGKAKELDAIKNITPKGVRCIYVRQEEALGLGHAILCAKEVVGEEDFAVLLADDLIKANTGALKQLVDHYERTKHYTIAVTPVPKSKTHQYGIVKAASEGRIEQIVEKPQPEVAPSNLGVVGRYVLPGSLFSTLEKTLPGAGGEIQLTDALSASLSTHNFDAIAIEGQRFDCGNKLDYLKATLTYGLSHPEVGAEWKAWLAKQLQTEKSTV